MGQQDHDTNVDPEKQNIGRTLHGLSPKCPIDQYTDMSGSESHQYQKHSLSKPPAYIDRNHWYDCQLGLNGQKRIQHHPLAIC
jgi:hypothetical protein